MERRGRGKGEGGWRERHTFAIKAKDIPVVHHVLIHIILERKELLLWVSITQ